MGKHLRGQTQQTRGHSPKGSLVLSRMPQTRRLARLSYAEGYITNRSFAPNEKGPRRLRLWIVRVFRLSPQEMLTTWRKRVIGIMASILAARKLALRDQPDNLLLTDKKP